MPLVRPELENIAVVELNFGFHFSETVFRTCYAPRENATIVRTSIAHDVIATAPFEIGGREAT